MPIERKISVIVPVLNYELISHCIKSLLDQEYSHYEIIIVDNDSDDHTPNVIKKYALKHKKIRVYSEKKRNSYHARNLGINKSTGTLLAFTDADCIVHKSWLTEINALLDHATEAIAGPGYLAYKPNLWAHLEGLRIQFSSKQLFSDTKNFAITKSFQEQIGFFRTDVNTAGDLEYGERIKTKYPKKLKFSHRLLVHHSFERTFSRLMAKARHYGFGDGGIIVTGNTRILKNRILETLLLPLASLVHTLRITGEAPPIYVLFYLYDFSFLINRYVNLWLTLLKRNY